MVRANSWTTASAGSTAATGGSRRAVGPGPTEGGPETGQGPLGPEDLERLEQRGPDLPSGDGHPDRGLGFAQLAAHTLGQGLGGGVEGVAGPAVGQTLVGFDGGGED